MVLHDVKEVGRLHLERIGVQEATAKGGLRHRDSSVEQTEITHAVTSAVTRDLVHVDSEHILGRQELQIWHWSSVPVTRRVS